MNDKLKTFVYTQLPILRGQRGVGGMRGPLETLVFATMAEDNGKTKSKYTPWKLRFSFHKKLMEITGWMKGDIINLAVNENGVCLYRDKAGRTLCTEEAKEKGASSRPYIVFTFADATYFPEMRGACTEVEASAGRVAFHLPSKKV